MLEHRFWFFRDVYIYISNREGTLWMTRERPRKVYIYKYINNESIDIASVELTDDSTVYLLLKQNS